MAWRWLMEPVVLAIHDEQIAEHGGDLGIRDHAVLDSALSRPRNQVAYGNPTVFDLAAGYAFGIVQNHPFIDGNKRTGFVAAYVFFALNGWELTVEEPEAATIFLALASGQIGEQELSEWMRVNSTKAVETE